MKLSTRELREHLEKESTHMQRYWLGYFLWQNPFEYGMKTKRDKKKEEFIRGFEYAIEFIDKLGNGIN